MSLTGARLRYLDENGQEVSVPAKGRTFQIGSSFSCDVILDPQAERLICEIKCDAFGRVTIHNQSNKETAIQLNEKIIHGQRGHPLLHGTRITILDRVYTWECHKMSGSEDVPSTPERLSPVEQAPNSCPSLKSHRPQIDKRLTVHNFRYSINSDDEGNTSIESRGHNESHLEEEESLNFSTPPSTETTTCETPKVDLVEATQNKENTATPPASHQQLLQLCALSDVVITSFSPRETGVKVEKSFTCVRKPTKVGKQVAASVTMSTPKSVYSTPKGGVLSELNDDSCSRDLVDFGTPSTSKKTKRESSMYLIDLTTPSKLRPSFKQQLPTPISVDSTDESSEGSPFVIDITKSDTPPTPSRSHLAKTPRRPAGAAAAATPTRTPQSLMKRALLTSTKKKQIATNQKDRTPVASPKRQPLHEARRLCRTSPRLPFPSIPTPEQIGARRAANKERAQAPNTTPRKRQSLHLGTPRDNKLSQIRKSLAAAKRSPTVDLGNRLKAKARRTLNSPKNGSPKSGSPKPASPAPRKTINLPLAKSSTPEKLDDSAKDELSRTFTVMDESGNPAEEGSVLGMMAALVTGEMDSSVASKTLETSLPATEIKEDQPPKNLETELHSAVEKVTSPKKDDAQLDEKGTESLKEAGKELEHKENSENSSIQANENVDGGNLIIEDSICEEIHANIPKPTDDDDIKSSDPVAAEENKEPISQVETPMIRRSLRRLSVDQRAGVATTPSRRSSTRRASVEASSSSKAEMKTEDSKIGTRRASCSALVDSQETGTPRRKRRFTEEMGTPTRQSKRLLGNTPKRALQVDDSIGDMGVIVEEAAGQGDDDEPPAIVEDENYGKELPSDEPDNVNYQGLRDLLKTPKNCSTPRFKGLREMMRTPKDPVSPIFGNIEELLDNSTIGSTPHRNKTSRSITVARVAVEEGKALDGVLKTPSARNIMVPIEPASAILKSRGDSLAATTEYDLHMTNTTLHLDKIFDDVPSTSVTNLEDTEAEINVTALSTASGLDPLRESVSSEAPMSIVKPAATDVASHKNDPLTSTTYKAALQTDLELSTFVEEVEASSGPTSPGSNEMSGIELLDQTSDSMFSEPLMVSGVESCKDFTVDETRASGRTTCPPIEMNEVDSDSNIGLTEPLVFSEDDDETEVLGDAGRTPKKSKANKVSIAYKLEESSTSKVNRTSVVDKTRENKSFVEEVSLIEVDESVPDDSINATNDGKSLVIELDSSSDTEAPPAKESNESAAVELPIVESESFPLDSTEDFEVLSTSVDQKPSESVSSISEGAKIATEVPTKPSDPEIKETPPSEEGDAEKSSTTDVASTDNENDNDVSSAQDPETFPLDSTADSSVIVEEEPIDTKEDSASKPAKEDRPVMDALPSEELAEDKTTGDDEKESDVSAVVESQTFPLDSTADSSVFEEEELSSSVGQKPIVTKEDSASKPAKEDRPVMEELAEETTTDVSAVVGSQTFPLDSTADSFVEEELASSSDQKPIDSESSFTKEDSAGKRAGEECAVIDTLPSEELAEPKTTEDDKTGNESSVVFSEIFPLDSTADSSLMVEEELSSNDEQKPIDSQLSEKPEHEDQPIEALPAEELTEEKATDAVVSTTDKLPVDAPTPDAVTDDTAVESLGQDIEPNRIITKAEVSLTSEVSLLETEESTKGDVADDSTAGEQLGLDTEAEPTTSEVSLVEAEEAKKGDTAEEPLSQDDKPNQNESISTDTKPTVEVSVPIDPMSEVEPTASEVTSVEPEEAAKGDLKKDDTSEEPKSEAEPSTSEESLVEAKEPEEGDVEEVATGVTATPDGIVTEKPTTNIQDVEVVPSAEESALKAKASPSPSPATIQGDDIVLETSATQDLVNSETVAIDLAQEVPSESSIQENNTKEDATETEIMQDKKPCGDQQTNGDEAEILASKETSKPNEEHETQVEAVSEAESDKEEPTIDQLSKDESAPVTAAEKSPLKEVVTPEESHATDIIAGDQQERDTPALEDSVVTVVLDDDSTSMETTQNGAEPASPNVVTPPEDKPGEETPLDTCSVIEDSFTEQPKEDSSDTIRDSKKNPPNQVESEDEVIQLDASSIVVDSGEDSVIKETPKAKSFVNDPEIVAINEDLTAQEVESKQTEASSVVSIETLAKESLEEETGQNNPPVTAEVSLTHNLDAAQDDSPTEKPEEVTTAKTLQDESITDVLESSATLEASSSSAVQEKSVTESPELSATEAAKSGGEISHMDEAREASATEEPLIATIDEEATATSIDQAEILSAHEPSRNAESAKENPQNEESTSTAEESEDKSQDRTEVQQLEEAEQVVPLASPKTKVVNLDEMESATNDVPNALTETKPLAIEEEVKDTVQTMSEEETEETAAQASESITDIGEQPQPDGRHMEAKSPAQKAIQTAAVEDADVIELSDDSQSESPLVEGTPVEGTPVEAIPVEEEDHNTPTVPAAEADTSVPVIEALATEDPKEGKAEDVPEDTSEELQEVLASDPITNQEEDAEKPQSSVEMEAAEPTLITESIAGVEQDEKAQNIPVEGSAGGESPSQEKDESSGEVSSRVELVSEPLHDLEASEKEAPNSEDVEASTKEASNPKDVEASKKEAPNSEDVEASTKEASNSKDVEASTKEPSNPKDVEASKKEASNSEDTQNEKLAAPNAFNSEPETSEILKKSSLEPSVSPEQSTMKASPSKPLPHEAEPSDKVKEELKPVKRATRKGSASVESPADDVPEKPNRRARKPSADVEINSEDIHEKPKRRAAARKPSAEVEAEPMSHIQEKKAETKEEEVLKVIPEEEPHSSRPNLDDELQKEQTHQKPEEDVQEKPKRRARKPSEDIRSAEIIERPKRRGRKPSAEVAESMVPILKEKEADEEPKEEEEAHSSKINKENDLQKEAENLQKPEENILKKPRHRGRNPSAEAKDETPKTSTDKPKRRGHQLPEEHIKKEKEITEELHEQKEGEELKKSDEAKQEEIIKSQTGRPKRRGRKASAEETETTAGKKPKIDELIPEEDAPKPNQDEQTQKSQQPEKPKGRGRKASAEEDANNVAKKPATEEVLQSIVEEVKEPEATSTTVKEEPVDVPAEGRSKRRGRKPSREEVVVVEPASQRTDSANGNAEKPLASVQEDQTTNLTEQNGPKKRTRKSSEFVPAAEVDEAPKEAERPKRRGRKPSVDIEHVAQEVTDKPRRRGRTPVDPEKQPLEEPDKKTRRTARKPSADTVDAVAHNTEAEQHLKDIEEVAEPETEPEAAMATSKQLPEEEVEEPKTRRRARKPVPTKKDTPEEGHSRRRGRKATEDEAPKSEAPVEAQTSVEEAQPNEVPAESNNEVQELPADVEAVTPVPTTEKKSTRRVRKASANTDEGTTAVAKKTTTRRGRKEDALVGDEDVQEKQIDLQQVPTEGETAALVMSASTTKIADIALGTSEDELTPRRREGRNMPRKNYDETSDEDKQRSARRARKPAASKVLALKAPEEEATPPPKRQPVEEVDTPANTVPMPEPTTSQRREGRNVPRKNYTEAPDDDKPSTSRSRRMRNLTAKALELIVDSSPRPNTPRSRKAKAGGEDETPAKKASPEAPPTEAESGADEEPAPPPVIAKGRAARRKADDDLAESGAAPPPSKRGARGQHEEPEEQPEAAKPAKKNVRATARKAKVETESESEPAVPAKKARGGSRAKTPVKPAEEKSATEPEEHSPPPTRKGRGGTRAKTPVVVVVEDSATEPEDEPAKKPAARSRARGAKTAAVPEQAQDSDAEAASSSSTTAARGGRAKKVHFEPTQTAATTVDASAEDAPKRATRSRRK